MLNRLLFSMLHPPHSWACCISSAIGHQMGRRLASDGMASAYGSTSRAPRPPPMPVPAMSVPDMPVYRKLDDVEDWVYRGKVALMQRMQPAWSVQECINTLFLKKGQLNDAIESLLQKEDAKLQADALSQPHSPIQRKV